MKAYRLALLATLALLTVVSLWLMDAGSSASSDGTAYASVADSQQYLVSARRKNCNDDKGGNGNKSGNGNGNKNSNGNGNSSQKQSSAGPAQPVPTSPPDLASACAPAGEDTSLSSTDGRVTLRVFQAMPRNVRLTIRAAVDPASVPPTPGSPVDKLLFQLQAEYCEGGSIAALPAEVNLGVHYADPAGTGLNKASFVIALLDPASNQWKPLLKQATDPTANYVSASITEAGLYSVYQH